MAGPTGIGKSTLLRRVAATLGSGYAHRVVWLRDPRSGYHALGQQLAIADAFGFGLRLPDPARVPEGAFDRAFQAQLWRQGCLLLLDDVTSQRYVQRFVPEGGQVACVMTTMLRSLSAWAPARLLLGGLDVAAARSVLESHVPPERLRSDDAGTARLLTLLAGYPRALNIAGRLLALEPDTTPGHYAARLEADPDTLALPREERASTSPWERRNVRLLASYGQMQPHLSADAWTLLLSLAPLAGAPCPIGWAAALAGLDLAAAQRAGGQLMDLHLLSRDPELQLDALAALFVRSRQPEPDPLLERLGRHAIAQAARLAGSAGEQLREYQRHRQLWASCLGALASRVAGGADPGAWRAPSDVPRLPLHPVGAALIDLVLALGPLLWTYSLPEARGWIRAAFAAARSLDHPAAVPLALLNGFHSLRVDGRLELLSVWYQAGADIQNDQAPWNASPAAGALAQVHCTFGDHRRAPALFDHAVALTRSPGTPPLLLATNLLAKACAGTRWQTDAGEVEAALAALAEAESVASAPGPLPSLIRAAARYNAAVIRTATGADVELERCRAQLQTLLELVDGPPARARLLATATRFRWLDATAELQRGWSEVAQAAGEWSFDRIQHWIGEFALFARLQGPGEPDPPPFAATGLWPSDLFGYVPHPELGGQPVTVLYALQPLLGGVTGEALDAILDRIARDYGQRHHVYVDLLALRRGR